MLQRYLWPIVTVISDFYIATVMYNNSETKVQIFLLKYHRFVIFHLREKVLTKPHYVSETSYSTNLSIPHSYSNTAPTLTWFLSWNLLRETFFLDMIAGTLAVPCT